MHFTTRMSRPVTVPVHNPRSFRSLRPGLWTTPNAPRSPRPGHRRPDDLALLPAEGPILDAQRVPRAPRFSQPTGVSGAGLATAGLAPGCSGDHRTRDRTCRNTAPDSPVLGTVGEEAWTKPRPGGTGRT